MAYQTAEDILAKWQNNSDFRSEAQEIKSIRRDLDTAREVIADGLARYKKKKLRSRSKKAAVSEDPFAELSDYSTRDQIQDDYGWGVISEAKMYRLTDLWDLREESKKKSSDSGYHDRVTDMLEAVLRSVGDEYLDQLFSYDEKIRKMNEEARKVASENNSRTREREKM